MRLRTVLLAVLALPACGQGKAVLLDLARDVAVADREGADRRLSAGHHGPAA